MTTMQIGWIGMGRMGFPMAERLVKAGYSVKVWNRTRSKAEPLQDSGAILVDRPSDLAGVDVLATMVSTGRDVEQLYFGDDGVLSGTGTPKSTLSTPVPLSKSFGRRFMGWKVRSLGTKSPKRPAHDLPP